MKRWQTIWAGPSPPHLDKIQKTSSIFSSPLENDLLAPMLKNSQEGREQASWWAQCVPQTDANRPQLKLLGNQGAHQRSACFLLLVLFSLTIYIAEICTIVNLSLDFCRNVWRMFLKKLASKDQCQKCIFWQFFAKPDPRLPWNVSCFSPPTNRLFKVAECEGCIGCNFASKKVRTLATEVVRTVPLPLRSPHYHLGNRHPGHHLQKTQARKSTPAIYNIYACTSEPAV